VFLEGLPVDWAEPELERIRQGLRHHLEIPGDPGIDGSLATSLADLGELLETGSIHPYAEVAYRTALLFDPGQVKARSGLGILALRFGRIQEAGLELRAALDRNPNHPRSLSGLAELLLDRGQVKEAKELVQHLLAHHPHLPQGLILAGSIDLFQGNLVGALSNLLESICLDPDHHRAFLLLAETYARAGHRDLRDAYLQAARLRLDPEHPPLPISPAKQEYLDLDPFLLQAPPEPPTCPTPPMGSPPCPSGPLKPEEALQILMEHSLEGGELGPEGMGRSLKVRNALRLDHKTFLEIYDVVRQSPPRETPPFDPIETFEELRRRAWRDGFLAPQERKVLEEVIRLLGIDRRKRPRPRPD
jgi:tetratricopeptide (TPR) repeat protein